MRCAIRLMCVVLLAFTQQGFADAPQSVTLPVGVDEKGARAEYKDGVLSLTLPKKANGSAKRISWQRLQQAAWETQGIVARCLCEPAAMLAPRPVAAEVSKARCST